MELCTIKDLIIFGKQIDGKPYVDHQHAVNAFTMKLHYLMVPVKSYDFPQVHRIIVKIYIDGKWKDVWEL